MKRTTIAALIGGLILFFWQFLSWGALNLHQPAQQYTPKQEAILSFLQQQQLPEGGYYLPGTPRHASMEEYDKVLQASAGKPWVSIQYHHQLKTNMGRNMVRGFVINVLTIALLCWIIGRFRTPRFRTVFTASLFTGLIVFFNVPYTHFIWYESFDIYAYLADAVVGWSLCGLWLGWYFRQQQRKANKPNWTSVAATMNVD